VVTISQPENEVRLPGSIIWRHDIQTSAVIDSPAWTSLVLQPSGVNSWNHANAIQNGMPTTAATTIQRWGAFGNGEKWKNQHRDPHQQLRACAVEHCGAIDVAALEFGEQRPLGLYHRARRPDVTRDCLAPRPRQ
jgi:hypothetical protein